MTALAFIAEDVILITSPSHFSTMTPEQFQAAVSRGQYVRRPDGTYVAASSLGARPGFDLRVCATPSPSSNINREFGAGVAESFFRADVAAEAVHCSRNRSN